MPVASVAVVILAALRLAHIHLLWADEDYHLAAAIQILKGHIPYREFWYDKPPLSMLFYLLIGGYGGWVLRILDVAYVLACCVMAYRLAKTWWGEREGLAAALLLAFFTTFYLTSATVPLAVDALMMLPHLAAVYYASQGKPVWCGVCCGLGILTNVKAVFVAATCALWLVNDLPLFAAGLSIPLGVGAAVGAVFGVLPDFYRQVWQWGLVYSGTAASAAAAVRRCADWLGFHAALLAGLIIAHREMTYRMLVWVVLSCAPLAMGNHFAPRYFFQLLPVMVIVASRGVVLGVERFSRTGTVVLALLLTVPLLRFGPHYGQLIWDNMQGQRTKWADAALDLDAQDVAKLINARKRPGDTLFVWGYRPDIYVYTRLVPDGKFSDSQPLDGVPADRHLESSEANPSIPAAVNRAELIRTEPTFVVDGLALLNDRLALNQFSDLREWIKRYRVVGETKLSRIYIRR